MREECRECGRLITAQGIAQEKGYCRGCYRQQLHNRPRWNLPPARRGSERLLTWSQRREAEQRGFNPEAWSPEFRKEMEDYWRARMKGEV